MAKAYFTVQVAVNLPEGYNSGDLGKEEIYDYLRHSLTKEDILDIEDMTGEANVNA